MRNLRCTVLLTTLVLTSFASAACTDLPTSLEDGGNGSGNTDNVGAGNQSGGGGAGEGGEAAGASGQGGDPTPQPASFTLTVDEPAPSMELRDSIDVNVSIAANGYVGPVALSVTGLPTDVTAQLMSPSVTLAGSGTESISVRFSSLSSTVTGDFPFMVTGTVDTGAKSASATITVEPAITVTIPMNLASYSGMDNAFGDNPTIIAALPEMSAENPITVRFFNADTVGHEIHSDAGNGFVHGNQSIPPMSFDPVVRQVNAPGEYFFYPHDIDTSIPGMIVIE